MWQRAFTAFKAFLLWVTASILSGYQVILAGLDALVGVWEESTRSVIRENTLQVQRAINGFSARVLSVFDRDYKRQLRASWTSTHSRHAWWKQDHQSTFNGIISRLHATPGTNAAAAPPGVPTAGGPQDTGLAATSSISSGGRSSRGGSSSSSSSRGGSSSSRTGGSSHDVIQGVETKAMAPALETNSKSGSATTAAAGVQQGATDQGASPAVSISYLPVSTVASTSATSEITPATSDQEEEVPESGSPTTSQSLWQQLGDIFHNSGAPGWMSSGSSFTGPSTTATAEAEAAGEGVTSQQATSTSLAAAAEAATAAVEAATSAAERAHLAAVNAAATAGEAAAAATARAQQAALGAAAAASTAAMSAAQRAQQAAADAAAAATLAAQRAQMAATQTAQAAAARAHAAQLAAAEVAASAAERAHMAARYISKRLKDVSEGMSGMSTAVYNSVRYSSAVHTTPLFEQPAGWGASEALKRTGLLEDISIWSQLAVSRLFGALRWLLALLSLQRLTTPAPPDQDAPTPAAGAAATGAAQALEQQQRRRRWWHQPQQQVVSPELQVLRGQMHKSHTQGMLQGAPSGDRRRVLWSHHAAPAAAAADDAASTSSGSDSEEEQLHSSSLGSSSSSVVVASSNQHPHGSPIATASGRSSAAASPFFKAAAAAAAAIAVGGGGVSSPGVVPHSPTLQLGAGKASSLPAAPVPSAPAAAAHSAAADSRRRRLLQRTKSGPAVMQLPSDSTTAQLIRMAGYPCEVHRVVTRDGYVLQMERIPLKGATEAVFMMHGVLDTSLTWVAGGVTGSQAFAAWDNGLDVWLGTTRSNPPHEAADASRQGKAYWKYTNNEVGVQDIGAQVDFIHETKLRELGAAAQLLRRSTSVNSSVASGTSSGVWAASRRASSRHNSRGLGGAGAASADGGRSSSRNAVGSRPASAAAVVSPLRHPHQHSQQQKQSPGWAEASGTGNSGTLAELREAANHAIEAVLSRSSSSGSFATLAASSSAAGSLTKQRSSSSSSSSSSAGRLSQSSSSGLHPWYSCDDSAWEASSQEEVDQSNVDRSMVRSQSAGSLPQVWSSSGAGAGKRQRHLPRAQSEPQVPEGAGAGSTRTGSHHGSSSSRGPGRPPLPRCHSWSAPRACQPLVSPFAAAAGAGDVRGDTWHSCQDLPAAEAAAASEAHLATTSSSRQGHAAARLTPPAVSGSSQPASRAVSQALHQDPYVLRVVAHSLGGMAVLIYCTERGRAGLPHHVRQLVLLTPAGYHKVVPPLFHPLVWPVYWMDTALRYVPWPVNNPVHLPTFIARLLMFKFSVDTLKLPAVGDLLRLLARFLLGGDSSSWERTLLMPHYRAQGMPVISLDQVRHFGQLYHTGRFVLFDYGSAAANTAAYGQDTPPDVGRNYKYLRGIPVSIFAGGHDGIIPPANTRAHYADMAAAGVQVQYQEFDYGHMDFTMASKEELGYAVNRLLTRPLL